MLTNPRTREVMAGREDRVLFFGFALAVAVAWFVEPGTDRVVVFTYIAASFAYGFWSDRRGASDWDQISHGIAALVPLFLWRAGIPVVIALAVGLAIHAVISLRRRV